MNKFNLPNLGFGMGLRTTHYSHILEHWPKDIDWFEIISENFMNTDGKPRRVLEKVRAHYPVVMHGVSLSIGTVDPLNSDYLKKLKTLADWLEPAWISDHLCWTGVAHKNLHDLMPVPYTEEALKHIVQRIQQVQEMLERPILLENPSTYLEFKDSHMPEWEFIARMAEEADCGLLLDANNIYVSCYNHRLDPKEYIDAIPAERVAQIHLAGHDNEGTHIVDTHRGEVIDEVWTLYRYILSRTGPVSTMVEWDADIPEFDVVKAEVDKARACAEAADMPNNLPDLSQPKEACEAASQTYAGNLTTLQKAVLHGDAAAAKPEDWIRPKPDFSQAKQLGVYINAYRFRLKEALDEEYPVLRHYLGEEEADTLINAYIEATPSRWYSVSFYLTDFPEFVKQQKGEEFAYELTLLETELSYVFDKAENVSLNPEQFTNIDPDVFLNTVFIPRAALTLMAFDYPMNAYFQAVKDGENPRAPKAEPSWLAVYRHEDTLWRLDLAREEYALLKLLFDGLPLGAALEKLTEDGESLEQVAENMQSWFMRWVNNGLLAEPESSEVRAA